MSRPTPKHPSCLGVNVRGKTNSQTGFFKDSDHQQTRAPVDQHQGHPGGAADEDQPIGAAAVLGAGVQHRHHHDKGEKKHHQGQNCEGVDGSAWGRKARGRIRQPRRSSHAERGPARRRSHPSHVVGSVGLGSEQIPGGRQSPETGGGGILGGQQGLLGRRQLLQRPRDAPGGPAPPPYGKTSISPSRHSSCAAKPASPRCSTPGHRR